LSVRLSNGQQINHLWSNPKVHRRTDNSPPDPTLIQLNPVHHTLRPYFTTPTYSKSILWNNSKSLRWLSHALVSPCSLVKICQRFRGICCPTALMMEAASTSETLVNLHQTTRRYNPEDGHLRTHRRENLKSYLIPTNYRLPRHRVLSTADFTLKWLTSLHRVSTQADERPQKTVFK
jgi:hypothetical protein